MARDLHNQMGYTRLWGSGGSSKGSESSTASLITSLFTGAGLTLNYLEARKARKAQEAQFNKMMEEMNKPGPKPLQQTGGGGIEPVSRSVSKKKRRAKGPSKANQGLLSMDTEPSLLR